EDSAPPEPPQIRQARTRLLAALDVAGASLPGDEWIVGQRVRYLLEDSQPRLAARAVEQCRAVRSWCEALGGLVQHASGEFAAAPRSASIGRTISATCCSATAGRPGGPASPPWLRCL